MAHFFTASIVTYDRRDVSSESQAGVVNKDRVYKTERILAYTALSWYRLTYSVSDFDPRDY